MAKYRRKPVEVEAKQFDGSRAHAYSLLAWILNNGGDGNWQSGYQSQGPDWLTVKTVGDVVRVRENFWIVRDVDGFHVFKPEDFEAKYEVI